MKRITLTRGLVHIDVNVGSLMLLGSLLFALPNLPEQSSLLLAVHPLLVPVDIPRIILLLVAHRAAAVSEAISVPAGRGSGGSDADRRQWEAGVFHGLGQRSTIRVLHRINCHILSTVPLDRDRFSRL